MKYKRLNEWVSNRVSHNPMSAAFAAPKMFSIGGEISNIPFYTYELVPYDRKLEPKPTKVEYVKTSSWSIKTGDRIKGITIDGNDLEITGKVVRVVYGLKSILFIEVLSDSNSRLYRVDSDTVKLIITR